MYLAASAGTLAGASAGGIRLAERAGHVDALGSGVWSGCNSGNNKILSSAAERTSPHKSPMSRIRAVRVRQKRLPSHALFLDDFAPAHTFLRRYCSIHCKGSSITRQRSFTTATGKTHCRHIGWLYTVSAAATSPPGCPALNPVGYVSEIGRPFRAARCACCCMELGCAVPWRIRCDQSQINSPTAYFC